MIWNLSCRDSVITAREREDKMKRITMIAMIFAVLPFALFAATDTPTETPTVTNTSTPLWPTATFTPTNLPGTYTVKGHIAELPYCMGAMRGISLTISPGGFSTVTEGGAPMPPAGDFVIHNVPNGTYIMRHSYSGGCNPFACYVAGVPFTVNNSDVNVSDCPIAFTPTVVFTHTYTYTNTATPTNTSTPTNTRTGTITRTFTSTRTPTKTGTPTRTWTSTPPTLPATFTYTPTYSRTITPAAPTFTYTRTPTAIPATVTYTATSTRTFTNTPTFTSTRTNTAVPPTFTHTNTITAVPPTATYTYTCTFTKTPTITKTGTPVPPTATYTPTKVPKLPYNTKSLGNVFDPDKGEQACFEFFCYPNDHIKIKIYDQIGNLITVLFENDVTTAGYQTVCWEGKNNKNKTVVSGIYNILIQCKAYKETQKVAVTR